MKTPKILKEKDKKVTECGCCYTSCGGSPAVLEYEAESKCLTEKLKKVK